MRGVEVLVIAGIECFARRRDRRDRGRAEQCRGGPPADRNYACPAIASRGRPARCSSLGSWSARWRRSNSARSGLARHAPRPQRPTRSCPLHGMAFTNRARDTRLEHQQRADQGNFAIDRTVSASSTHLTGRHGDQHNRFDSRRRNSGTCARRHDRRGGVEDTPKGAASTGDNPRSGRGGRTTTSASGNACRRVRCEGPCSGPGRDRHQYGPGVPPATASDNPSRRSSRLPRPTERAERQFGQVDCGGTHTRTAPARWTHDTPHFITASR